MANFKSLVLVILVLVNLGLFVESQEAVSLIGPMDITETLKGFNSGDTINTDLLVCNNKNTLLGVLESMQNQALDTNLSLEEDLFKEVALHCWVNNAVELSFESLDAEIYTLIQILDTAGFQQNSTIRLINVKVSGVSLGPVHTFANQRIALAGTYGEFSQSAYFLSLESLSIARQ